MSAEQDNTKINRTGSLPVIWQLMAGQRLRYLGAFVAMLLAAMRIPVDERAAHKNDLEVVAGALFIMAEMHVMLNRIIPPWVFEQAKDILTSNTENGE